MAVAALAVLLLLLPRFASRALDDHGALATELSLSTTALALSLLAGLAGVLSSARGTELGPAAELGTSPLRAGEYVVGRFAGIVSVSTVALVLLALAAMLGAWLAGGASPPAIVPLALATGGVLLQACLLAAIGALIGAALPLPSGVLLLLAFVASSRLLIPGLIETAAAPLGYLLPDPARLDLSRELGFARPIAVDAALLAWAAVAAQVCALLALSSVALERREV